MGFSFVPLTLTAVAGVAREESGLASGLLNTFQQVGGALGLAVLSTFSARAFSDRLAEVTAAAPAGTAGAGTLPRELMDAAALAGYTRGFEIASFMALGALAVVLLTIRNTTGRQAAAEKGEPVVVH